MTTPPYPAKPGQPNQPPLYPGGPAAPRPPGGAPGDFAGGPYAYPPQAAPPPPPKSSKRWLIWVLVGAGVLMVVCVGAVVAAGVFFSRAGGSTKTHVQVPTEIPVYPTEDIVSSEQTTLFG